MSRAVEGIKGIAKRILRSYGVATSRLRGIPDFIIIGAKRGGTTSLYRYLTTHPQVRTLFPGRQQIKGTYFFDVNYPAGEGWYRSHFPVRRKDRGRITGEASPYYLFHPLAAQRAARVAPGAKLIVLLRHPAERAYSHWREQVRRGFEELTFEEALDAEAGRLRGEEERILADPAYHSYAHEHHSYVAQGHYARCLRRWLEVFPREQFLLLKSEDLYRSPHSTYARVLDFLGIERILPDEFAAYNAHPSDGMPTSTRRRLVETFAEPNRELAAFDPELDLSEWTR